MPDEPLAKLYDQLRDSATADLKSAAVAGKLASLCELSLKFVLRTAEFVDLVSNVPGKTYAMARLKKGSRSSRPINKALFDPKIARSEIGSVLNGGTTTIGEERLGQLLYTLAMSYCLAVDLVSVGNKKSPGTFFEIFVGHLAARRFKANPARQIAIPSLEIENTLPTDFIFDLGPNKSKIHMPVKISTRERVVQAWAHQKVLEGVHGAGRFRGVLVILTETNKQKEKSVVEVCLPGQWAAYQMYIAPMHRVYYFDVPKRYEPLRDNFPHIQIWPFSRFFREYSQLGNPRND
jgi:hypothetical protein